MPIAIPLAAAAVGAAGTAYAANQANKATQRGIDAQTAAANQNYQLQQQALQQAQQNNAPFMQAGYGALNQLAQQFGLGTISPTGQVGGNAPTGQQPAYDPNPYSQYEAANPDLAAEARRVVGVDPRFRTAEDYYRWHDANYANEGRGSFTNAPTSAPQQAAQQPAATQGVGAQYGPTVGERATFTRPEVGPAPGLPSLTTESYRASPGFQNRLTQAGRATNAQFAARGILGSGAAAEEFGKRMQNIADEDYDSWVNQQMGLYDRQLAQYNADRARADTNFAQDRSYGTGVYDADRNYLTSRFDQNVNDLFSMVGLGQSSANNQAAAQRNYASNVGNQANTLANNLSSAYGQQASNNASAWNNIAGMGQNLLSNWSSTARTPTTNNPNAWSQNWGGGS